jgi:hypothetical protein
MTSLVRGKTGFTELERPPPRRAGLPYREAIELAPTDVERRYLAERLRELDLAT